MSVRIYYTGDLIVPDASDSFDGEPCEDGTGATVSHGWVDPDWSLGEVREERDDVRPDAWQSFDSDGPVIDWVVERIGERLGWVESPEHADGTLYASEATGPYDACYTGVSLRMAAHVEGLSPVLLRAVSLALVHAQRRTA